MVKLVAELISILKRVCWGGTAVGPPERSPLLTSSSSQQTSYTHTDELGVSQITVAYSRPKNAKDLPSKAKLHKGKQKEVSIYYGGAPGT